MKKQLLTSLFLAAVTLAPTLARAADPAEKTVEAHALTDKAAALYDEGVVAFRKSKWAEARAAFLAAWALKQHWQIAANLADCEMQLGRFIEAAEHAAYYAKNAPADRRDRANKLLTDASAKIATVTIDVQPEGAEILVDGQTIGRAPLSGPAFLEPGARTITARVPGRPDAVRALTLVAGKDDKVLLQVDAPAVKPPITPPPLSSSSTSSRSLVPGIVIAGLGAAALATGIGFLVDAGSKGSTLDTMNQAVLKANHSCVAGAANFDDTCDAIHSMASSATTRNHVGIGLMAGAGVAAVGAIAYFLWPASKPSPVNGRTLHVVPIASGTGAGLNLLGAF
jgi:PEGA domain